VKMKISSIVPEPVGDYYRFIVTFLVGSERVDVRVSAVDLLDYSRFREVVLYRTGRFFGENFYHNWNQEVSGHLDRYWEQESKRVECKRSPLLVPVEPLPHDIFRRDDDAGLKASQPPGNDDSYHQVVS